MQVKNLNKSLLALAFSAAGLVFAGSAMACTTDNWDEATANAIAGNQKGRDSEPATPRYAGTCGLKTDVAGSSYVTDNSPAGESVYRARFYVWTGTNANSPKIFSATTADSGGGTEAVGITLSGGQFQFTVAGTTVPTVGSIANDRWYAIEIHYQSGGPFTAKVRGNRATAETVVSSAGNASANLIQSARLGVLNAAASASAAKALAFDAFESTRSASTEIGRLCPGDAAGGAGGLPDGQIGAADAIAVSNEFPSTGTYALGQADCTEDGVIDAADAICIANRFGVAAQRTCTQK